MRRVTGLQTTGQETDKTWPHTSEKGVSNVSRQTLQAIDERRDARRAACWLMSCVRCAATSQLRGFAVDLQGGQRIRTSSLRSISFCVLTPLTGAVAFLGEAGGASGVALPLPLAARRSSGFRPDRIEGSSSVPFVPPARASASAASMVIVLALGSPKSSDALCASTSSVELVPPPSSSETFAGTAGTVRRRLLAEGEGFASLSAESSLSGGASSPRARFEVVAAGRVDGAAFLRFVMSCELSETCK